MQRSHWPSVSVLDIKSWLRRSPFPIGRSLCTIAAAAHARAALSSRCGARPCTRDIRPALLAEAADGGPRRVVTHTSNKIIHGWDRWRLHGCIFIQARSFRRMMQSKQAPPAAAEPTSRPPHDHGLRTGAPLHPVHEGRRTVRPSPGDPCIGTVGDAEAPRACPHGGERAQRGTGDEGTKGVDGSDPSLVHPGFTWNATSAGSSCTEARRSAHGRGGRPYQRSQKMVPVRSGQQMEGRALSCAPPVEELERAR